MNSNLSPDSAPSNFSVGLVPACTAGFGSYRDYRKTGVGADLFAVMGVGPFALKPLFTFSYNVAANSSIDKSLSMNLSLLGGYPVRINESFRITSFAGGGLIVHKISEKKDGKNESKNYYNSTAQVSADIEYLFSTRFSFVFAPSYNLVFEDGRRDQFIGAGVGVKMGL